MSSSRDLQKSNSIRDRFVIFANFRELRDENNVKSILILTLILAGVASGVRQIIRLRLEWDYQFGDTVEGEVDLVNVLITILLTVTFYPLLYFSYSYIYKGTEQKDTTIVLHNVSLVAQFAIVRDLMYILFAFLEYGADLAYTDGVNSDPDSIFRILDGVLWAFTIILLVPLVVSRLNRPKDQEDTQALAFFISFTAFWLTWIFNFVIVRIFIQLPLGRDF